MNDSHLFQRTLLWLILPAAVAEDAPETVAVLGMSKIQGFKQCVHKAAVV
jgi:hypothetical protein